MLDSLVIGSPKRKRNLRSSWADFFPYYAGFPEDFATKLIQSTGLPASSTIFDPWNGSGTTTYAASRLGYTAYGIDLNPVMVLVAKARSLAATEADSIVPQAKSLTKDLTRLAVKVRADDPLLQWFDITTGNLIRSLETRIRSRLVGSDESDLGSQFNKISCFAATFYVALFTICRKLTLPYRSSNPTWLKLPKNASEKLCVTASEICGAFMQQARGMASALQDSIISIDQNKVGIAVGDTTFFSESGFADMVLTSPPYCTRIDYTAATRVELAVISPLMAYDRNYLSKRMIGSIKVPTHQIMPSSDWGETCIDFLQELERHSSVASKGYYYKTHIDYFDKLARSLRNVHRSLKDGAIAVMVVQDSYYKNLHNNLPKILCDMAENLGLMQKRREDFIQENSFLGINSRSLRYRLASPAVESVICFEKVGAK